MVETDVQEIEWTWVACRFADGHGDGFIQSQHDYGWLAGNYCFGFTSDYAHYFSVHLYDVLWVGAAIAVCVSNFKGQNDMVNVRRSAYAGYHLILAMAVVLLSIVFLLRNQVGGWFTDSVEVSAMVSSLFLPFLVYQFGDGLQISFANALRGIARRKTVMFIAFISYFVISLPVGYLCGFVLGWGTVGVWMAFPFGLTSAGIMLWLRFRYKTKDK